MLGAASVRAQAPAEPEQPPAEAVPEEGEGDAEAPVPAEEPQPTGPVIVPPAVLELPAAVYPPAALEANVQADVVFVIDIAVDGAVSAAVVDTPAGHGFDEAAMEAVLRMRFSPATVDGVATPVRIKYTYRFTIEERVVEPDPEPEPEPEPEPVVHPVSVVGEILERGTRRPLAGVPVFLLGTDESFISDAEGRFEARTPPSTGRKRKTWVLEVPLPGYAPLRRAVTPRGDKPIEVTLWLTRDTYSQYRTTIKRPKLNKEVTRKAVSAAEIQKIPGNSGDALKVVQILPGVARGALGTGPPIIRGSSPLDSKSYLEGHLLPQLFHFGGLYSVINTDLLSEIEYWPGGFSTRYGQAIGGTINVELREPKLDRWHGVIETNLYHASVMAEGPLGEKTGLALSLRRSYIDALLPLVVPQDTFNFVVAPRYYDYQVRFTHEFDSPHRIGLLLYGSDDELKFIFKEPVGRGGIISGGVNSRFAFHLLTGTWDWDIASDLRLHSSFRAGWQEADVTVGSILSIVGSSFPVDLRSELEWDILPFFTLLSGVQGGVWPFELEFAGPRPPKEGHPPTQPDPDDVFEVVDSGLVAYVAPYTEATLRIADAVTIVAGLRMDVFHFDGATYASLDPRLALRVDIVEGTTVKGYAGLYHQPPTFDEWARELGTPELGPERAFQVSIGAEQRITEFLHVDLQLFYKWMDDLVVPGNFLADGVRYTNDGVGRVYGLEVMIKHDLSRCFFGWLSYSLMRAERRDGPLEEWRRFDFDQTHILSAVGMFRLGSGWEAGFRFRYTTGNPRTPVVAATFDSDTDAYLPVYGEINSTRFPAFHQLDLRVDKKFVFDTWMLDIYLEVQNVYLHENVEGIDYNYDFTENQPITGIPFLPNLGIRADF